MLKNLIPFKYYLSELLGQNQRRVTRDLLNDLAALLAVIRTTTSDAVNAKLILKGSADSAPVFLCLLQ